MKVVIQCAATKHPDAGFFKTANGVCVSFVAHPELSPPNSGCLYKRPDDPSDTAGMTWRDKLSEYNLNDAGNPFGLLPAYQLYRPNKCPTIYRDLVGRCRAENVFILSSGWGLIRSDFLTPRYDITFTAKESEAYRQRKSVDVFDDFRHLTSSSREEIVFFGGERYYRLFDSMTQNQEATKIIFHRSKQMPTESGFHRYKTNTRTNWHYECVVDFLSGKLAIRPDC